VHGIEGLSEVWHTDDPLLPSGSANTRVVKPNHDTQIFNVDSLRSGLQDIIAAGCNSSQLEKALKLCQVDITFGKGDAAAGQLRLRIHFDAAATEIRRVFGQARDTHAVGARRSSSLMVLLGERWRELNTEVPYLLPSSRGRTCTPADC